MEEISIKANSPHDYKVYPKDHHRFKNLRAYPGWRFRLDSGRTLYHEKIPNPLLRFLDRLIRRAP